jgi:hypothetical protein
MSEDTIFVSIASYRDSELDKTIADLLDKAEYPNRIIIGVCLQDTSIVIDNFKYKNNKQIKALYIPFQDAKGVCFARYLIQTELLTDEKYFLQIDSHSRFAYSWDTHLIEQLVNCTHNKPILSCYPNHYDLMDNTESYLNSKYLSKHKYESFLGTTLRTSSTSIFKDATIVSNWIAAGFLFTISSWCREVVYPKRILFNGEEDYLFIKSFINQYEIFCPPTCNVYHCYTNNLTGSPEKYRQLIHEDVDSVTLNCSINELEDIIMSMTDTIYNEFKTKYGVCYKTKTIFPTS